MATLVRHAVVVAGFPNPVGWAVDRVKDFVGGVAENGFELVIGGLTAWVIDAVAWVVGGVFNFFLDSTDPNVQADWFVGRGGPYAMTAAIGATLLVGFLLAGIVQGVLVGDTAGMLRRMIVDLPVAVLGMVGLVTFTQALVALTDALSNGVLDAFTEDVKGFSAAVSSLAGLGGSVATAFVIFLLGLVAVVAGIVLVAELVIRSALVYLVVALAPLVFAVQVWPALRGMGRKLLELLVALVASKLVIAVALAVSAAAAVGVGSGGEVTALPPPEVVAEDPGGSVTQAVGILLAAVAAFGVAAFSPLIVVKLLPVTEAALVAQGLRGGPVRAGTQAITLGYYTRYMRGGLSRSGQLAAGGLGGPEGGGGGAGGAAGGGAGTGVGGGGAGMAAAGPTGAAAGAGAAVAGITTRAASSGARAMSETATSASGDRGPSDAAVPPPAPQPGPGAVGERDAPAQPAIRPAAGPAPGEGEEDDEART